VTLDHAVKGAYAVRIQAGDGTHSIVETFTINVVPPNQAPFAEPDSKITQVSQAVTIMVLANDGDDDGILDPLTVTIVAPPANGTAEVNADGTITYTPAAEFEGQDAFEYTVADDQGSVSNAAVVTIHVGPTWQNPIENLDIDGNTTVNILDLLAIVNFLRDHGVGHALNGPPGPGEPMVDVDGDGVAEIGDLLALVQHLRENQGNAEPEGEAEEQFAAPANDASILFALDDEDDPWSCLLDEVAQDVATA
jgi:hypothetical protein